jgi:hypothetical protein
VKPLAIWLAAVAVVFGGFALVARSTQETSKVFVFVDSSNPMDRVWRDVPAELDRIDNSERSEFSLAHGQSRGSELVHTWQSTLALSGVTPFAPCSFAEIDGFAEAVEADRRILVTTAGSCDTAGLDGWEIVLVDS